MFSEFASFDSLPPGAAPAQAGSSIGSRHSFSVGPVYTRRAGDDAQIWGCGPGNPVSNRETRGGPIAAGGYGCGGVGSPNSITLAAENLR
jgi:hypothetical protein